MSQIKKNDILFHPFFALKNWVWESFDVSFKLKCSLWDAWTIYATMDSFLVLILRYKESKIIKRSKVAFFWNFFSKKNMKPNFLKFFQRKSSLRSSATFSENMVSKSILSFEKFAPLIWKVKSAKKIKQSPSPKNRTDA